MEASSGGMELIDELWNQQLEFQVYNGIQIIGICLKG